MADAPPSPPVALPSLKQEEWLNGRPAPVAVKAEPRDAASTVDQPTMDAAAAPDAKPALELAVNGAAKRPADAMEREEEEADAKARAAPTPIVLPPTGVIRNSPSYEHLLEVKRRVETALELDHIAVLRPNLRPFTSFEDVVERLLPYHVFYNTELDVGDLDEPELKHVIAQEEALQVRLAAVVQRARRLAACEAQAGVPASTRLMLSAHLFNDERAKMAELRETLAQLQPEMLPHAPPVPHQVYPSLLLPASLPSTPSVLRDLAPSNTSPSGSGRASPVTGGTGHVPAPVPASAATGGSWRAALSHMPSPAPRSSPYASQSPWARGTSAAASAVSSSPAMYSPAPVGRPRGSVTLRRPASPAVGYGGRPLYGARPAAPAYGSASSGYGGRAGVAAIRAPPRPLPRTTPTVPSGPRPPGSSY